jgi:hypothetical protein
MFSLCFDQTINTKNDQMLIDALESCRILLETLRDVLHLTEPEVCSHEFGARFAHCYDIIPNTFETYSIVCFHVLAGIHVSLRLHRCPRAGSRLLLLTTPQQRLSSSALLLYALLHLSPPFPSFSYRHTQVYALRQVTLDPLIEQ